MGPIQLSRAAPDCSLCAHPKGGIWQAAQGAPRLLQTTERPVLKGTTFRRFFPQNSPKFILSHDLFNLIHTRKFSSLTPYPATVIEKERERNPPDDHFDSIDSAPKGESTTD